MVELNKVLISIGVNVQQWLFGDATQPNNNVLLVVSNAYTIVHLDRTSIIPDNIIKGSILAIVKEGANLVIYSGSNLSQGIIGRYVISMSVALSSLSNLYIGVIIDYSTNTLSYSLWADNLQIIGTVNLSNTPGLVTANTGFYIHQSVINTNCECHDPRFDLDLLRFRLQRNSWQVLTSNICNPGLTIPTCSKCVLLQGEIKTTCIQCAPGFSNILGKCLPTRVCADWVNLETYHSQFGPASHGDNDTDSDEISPIK